MLFTNDFRFPAWAIQKWDIQGGDLVKWEYISQLYEFRKMILFRWPTNWLTLTLIPVTSKKCAFHSPDRSFPQRLLLQFEQWFNAIYYQWRASNSEVLRTRRKMVQTYQQPKAYFGYVEKQAWRKQKTKQFLQRFYVLVTQGYS